MKKQKRKAKIPGYSQSVPWNPIKFLKKVKSKAKPLSLRERLLRRWKGTALEVRTLCWGPMQRDDEVGGKEMDQWLNDIVRGKTIWHGPVRFGVSTVGPISTSY